MNEVVKVLQRIYEYKGLGQIFVKTNFWIVFDRPMKVSDRDLKW